MQWLKLIHVSWWNVIWSRKISKLWDWCLNFYFRGEIWWASRQLLIHRQHDDVIKCKQFPRYWTFVRGINRSPVNSLHKGQWRGALMFSLICAWINGWVNNGKAGDLRRHRAHYDVMVMNVTFLIPHYSDVIMSAMASQITGVTIVYSTVRFQIKRKHRSSVSLAFVRGIHRWPVNSPYKGPATRKMFPFDDVIIAISPTGYLAKSYDKVSVLSDTKTVPRPRDAMASQIYLVKKIG